jgi:hypothetical protein
LPIPLHYFRDRRRIAFSGFHARAVFDGVNWEVFIGVPSKENAGMEIPVSSRAVISSQTPPFARLVSF